jgi:hypothetical protein
MGIFCDRIAEKRPTKDAPTEDGRLAPTKDWHGECGHSAHGYRIADMASNPTPCKVPQTTISFLRKGNTINLSNCVQETSDSVLPDQLCPAPPIDAVSPSLRGSCCALFSVVHHPPGDILPSPRRAFTLSHSIHRTLHILSHSIKGAESASGFRRLELHLWHLRK